MSTTVTFKIDPETRVLLEAPVWENHKRGKNWLATIEKDPAAPGGLGRKFAPKARGEGFYVLPLDLVHAGDPVEFGADYYSGSGTKRADRWYGVVLARTNDLLTVEVSKTGARAVARAREVREALLAQVSAPPTPSKAELLERACRTLLLARARGEAGGVSWEDLDAAAELARQGLGEEAVAEIEAQAEAELEEEPNPGLPDPRSAEWDGV